MLLFGDEILPSYTEIIVSYEKDPVMNQSGFHGMSCHGLVAVAHTVKRNFDH